MNGLSHDFFFDLQRFNEIKFSEIGSTYILGNGVEVSGLAAGDTLEVTVDENNTINGVNAIKLTGSGSSRTITAKGTTTKNVAGEITNVDGKTININSTGNLTFKDVGSTASITLVQPTTAEDTDSHISSVNVTKGTLKADETAATRGVPINGSTTATKIDKGGFTYNASDETLTLTANNVIVNSLSMSQVYVIPTKSSTTITFQRTTTTGEGDDAVTKTTNYTYTFKSKGSAAFMASGGESYTQTSSGSPVKGFHFGSVGEKLTFPAGGLGNEFAFSYGTKYTNTFKIPTPTLPTYIYDGGETLEWKSGNIFEFGNLFPNTIVPFKDTSFVQFYVDENENTSGSLSDLSHQGGGAVSFDAKKGTLDSITVDEDGAVLLSGFANGKDVTINKNTVNIKIPAAAPVTTGEGEGATTTTTPTEFTYQLYDKDNPVLDLTKCESTTQADGIVVKSAGDAKQLNIHYVVEKITINGTVFNLDQYNDKDGEDDGSGNIFLTADETGSRNAFVLDGDSNATGFIFDIPINRILETDTDGNPISSGEASLDTPTTLFFTKGVPSGFTLYNYDTSDSNKIALPTISGTGEVAIGKVVKPSTIKATDTSESVWTSTFSGKYKLIVGKGAVVENEDGVKLDFSGLAKGTYALVEFDKYGSFTGVLAINDTSVTDIQMASAYVDEQEAGTGFLGGTFAAGTSIVVTGNVATSITEGIQFGKKAAEDDTSTINYVATASGNYTYGVDSDGAVLTLNEATDEVFSTSNATKVLLGGTAGTITYNDEDYVYASADTSAYFIADPATATLTDFVFVKQGDSITLPEDMAANGLTLKYQPFYSSEDPADINVALPIVNGSAHKITMVVPPRKATPDSAIFELSDLAENATATFGEAQFTFSDAGGSVRFDQAGDAKGFGADSGTVTMNADAAAMLAAPDEDEAAFTINGTDVAINATGATELVYTKGEDAESLFGLQNNSVIVDAGPITRIYAAAEESTFTFGEGDSAVDFTATAQGSDADDLAYYTVDGAKATGFTFIQRYDAIILPAEMPEGFKLYDTANDTEGFLAPVVTDATSGEAQTVTVAKTVNGENTECYEITSGDGELAGKKIAFTDGATLTFNDANNETAVFFNTQGKLLNIENLNVDNNEVIVEGATEAIKIDASEIEITGGGFTYRIQEGGAPSIVDLVASSKVVKAAGVQQLWTISDDTKGNGEFTFGASAVYTIEGLKAAEDTDGIRFDYDGEKVTGISSVEGNASVTGALAELQTLNGNEFTVTPATAGTKYTFSGTSFAGLKNGDAVVTAGALENFLTAEDGSFDIIGAAMSIADDANGVTFNVADESLTAINDLDADATATGDFSGGLSVNGKAIEVTGDDDSVVVTGADDGVARVGGLNGADVVVAKADDVTQIGAVGDGKYTFAFAAGESFAVTGNSSIETTFDLTDGKVTAINGLDSGEEISGKFDDGIAVEGKNIQVTDDDGITVANGASGLAIRDMSNGAALSAADDIYSAWTDPVADSGTFTFVNGAFSIAGQDADGVEFVLDGKGNVVGVNNLDATATISGNLNNVVIDEKPPAIIVKSAVEEGGYNTHLTFEAGILSGLVDGDTVVSADGVAVINNIEPGTFTFDENSPKVFTVEGDSSVDFVINPIGELPVNVAEIQDLAEGATLRGDLGSVSSVNHASFDVQDADGFAVVGANNGISKIIELGDGATVNDAGGASQAVTNSDGTFTFAGQSFRTLLDNQIIFELDADSKVTAIKDFSGFAMGALSGIEINGKTFDIQGDSDGVFSVGGNSNASGILFIGNVGGSAVTINSTGGASVLVTNEEGKYTFTASGQEFTTDDDILWYTLNGDTVTNIESLMKSVTGSFDEITAVNGASFSVQDDDGILTVVGNEAMSGISKIADVDGVNGAVIENAGGAAEVVTSSDGVFAFAGHSNPFVIAGDSSVTFQMDTTQPAKVLGIADFGDQVPATVTGELMNVELVGVGDIKVTGDEDNLLSYSIAEDGTKTLGEVGGDNVTLDAIGGASFVQVVQDGVYTFGTNPYTLSGGDDNVIFGDTSIEDLDGTVEGNFDGDTTVNGKAVNVAGDSVIGVLGTGGNSVALISKLSANSKIVAADDVYVATTDGEGVFTFADERQITIAGDSQVNFQLDGRGNLVAVGDLDPNATISGDLNGLTVNDTPPAIIVRSASESSGYNTHLTYDASGVLSGLVDGDTVISADNVSTVRTVEDGTFTFGEGGASFAIAGDSSVDFQINPVGSVSVAGVDALQANGSIVGALNGLTVNNGSPLAVDGDDFFGAVAGNGSLSKLYGLGGGSIIVNNADGAKTIQSDSDGTFTILANEPFTVRNDADGVVFTLDENDVVNSIGDVEGSVLGNFASPVAVNGEPIQVTNDPDGVEVSGDGAKVTALDDVDAGATVVTWGSASRVGAEGIGTFTFGTNGASFANTGDDNFNFLTGTSGVTGISEFQDGTFTFSTLSTELDINSPVNPHMTFGSTSNVTLTIVNSKVVSIEGVTGSVDGAQDALIIADGLTNPLTVNGGDSMIPNGREVDITDANNYYEVLTSGGAFAKAQSVTGGDAIVYVREGTIESDADGFFNFGGEDWTFTDDDGFMSFETDENKLLKSVDSLTGSFVDPDGKGELTVNGDVVGYNSNTPVTISTDGSDITSVEGLDDGDSVYGNLDNASIPMGGNSSTVTGTSLNINGHGYTLFGDGDGITLNGAGGIVGLDDNSSVVVDTAGTYVVNGTTLDAEEGDTIVGDDNKTYAYIYDPDNIFVRRGTTIDEIEGIVGVDYTSAVHFGGTRDDGILPEPLNREESEDLKVSTNPEDDLNQPAEIWLDNKDNKVNQDLDLSPYDFSKKVHLHEGPQSVEFNDDAHNLLLVEKGKSSGKKSITLGDGGDAVVMDETAALDNEVAITGGAGDDTYFIRYDAATTIDMSAGGADKIVTYGGANANVKANGYDASTGAGIRVDEKKTLDLAAAVQSGEVLSFNDGVVEIQTGSGRSLIDVGTNENGGTLVNLYTPYGDKQQVGFTNSNGGAIDGSASTENVIYIGNRDGSKSGGSTLTGGIGNDTAQGGAGDVIDMGAGDNQVELEDNAMRGGATVNLNQGRTTITGTNNTLDEAHGDVLGVDLTQAEVSYDGTNLIVEGVTSDVYAVVENADKAGTLTYDTAEDLATSADEVAPDLAPTYDKYTTQIIQSGDAKWRSAIGMEGSVMQVEVDEDMRANYYKGVNSGVTFAGYTGDVVVDLEGNWAQMSLIDGREAVFDGINSVKAGAAGSYDQIKGSDENETLLAGQGYASLYGDGGNNVLYGYNSDAHADKEGYTTFFVLGQSNGAANIIKDFEFVTDNNYKDTQKVTADMIEVKLEDSRVLDAYLSGNDVVIDVINNTNGVTESAIIEGAKGKDMRVTNGVIAQVNEDSLTFDEFANYYFATGKNATVNVKSTLDEANVWLGRDSQLKKDFFGDIAVLDATGFTGKAQLVGTDWRDNTIIAGSGETSLWGGASNYNDVMQGGAGKDTFHYAYGNGNDTVNGAGNGDVVNLAANLSDLYTEINADNVVIHFTDGGKLTVNDGGADVSYIVQGDNNATYKVDRTNNTWIRKG